MQKNDGVPKHEIEHIENLYGVKCWEVFDDPITVFRGCKEDPKETFKKGFPRAGKIRIEDSMYLLDGNIDKYVVAKTDPVGVKQGQRVSISFVDKATKRRLVPPGGTSGLVSTTVSPIKAYHYACQSFHVDLSAKHRSLDRWLAELNAVASSRRPIGYVYAIETKGAFNISKHFQWEDLDGLLEQEMAMFCVPASDVHFAIPIVLQKVSKYEYRCQFGEVMRGKLTRELSKTRIQEIELCTDDGIIMIVEKEGKSRLEFTYKRDPELTVHVRGIPRSSIEYEAILKERRALIDCYCWGCKTRKESGPLRACSGCHTARFCSVACSKAAWDLHKSCCTK
jgi:hypothetical protein